MDYEFFHLEKIVEKIEKKIIDRRQNRLGFLGFSESLCQLIFSVLIDSQISEKVDQPHRNIVFVLPTDKDVKRWSLYFDRVFDRSNRGSVFEMSTLPWFNLWGNGRFAINDLYETQRIFSLFSLGNHKRYSVLFTTLQGLFQYTVSADVVQNEVVNLSVGQVVDLDEIIDRVIDIGYINVDVVEAEGTYSVRGGVLDLFSSNYKDPIRIELIGDEISSIRFFSIQSQRSFENVTDVAISLAREIYLPISNRKADAQKLYDYFIDQNVDRFDRDGMVSLFQQGKTFPSFTTYWPLFWGDKTTAFDYLKELDLLVFPKPIDICLQSYIEALGKNVTMFEKDIALNRASIHPERYFVLEDEVRKKLGLKRLIFEFGNTLQQHGFETFIWKTHTKIKDAYSLKGLSGFELFEKWMDIVADLRGRNGNIVVFAHHEKHLDRIKNLFANRNIDTVVEYNPIAKIRMMELKPGLVYLGLGELQSHIWLKEESLLLIPEHELLGVRRQTPNPPAARIQNLLDSFRDLDVNSLVVHVKHGIARYKGMKTLDIDSIVTDFLILEFDGNDKLYLPVDKLNMLQKYSSGGGGKNPSLDRLRGVSWEKRKSKVGKAVDELAEKLLQIQARRKIVKGHSYSQPSDMYYQFESDFLFEETDDQLTAIKNVNDDLSGTSPMDRLICGDVGFGKTEVALRAAMRVVLDGRQVMILTPTTVLCHQHFRTFEGRFEKYGVRVEQLNRFIKPKKTKEIMSLFQEGKVDILVGTHKLLSKKLKTKRLGLIVIDEEHRFGVDHKESLKEFGVECEVLALTATPIPRTLHMAILGIRDISVIMTPPCERLAIKTYISEYDDDLVKESIVNEISRGGQVFFLHNRVRDIEERCQSLKDILPYVDIRFAHGQMRSDELEKVMVDFIEKRFSVLVCTTIIESGIDLPNVNTLIVNRADKFGLAQLYQMRGRVGRSRRQSYAFFLTKKGESISDDSRKRLEILAAHQDLGSGFQIANYDLEMRGAGTLLGGEQSGYITEVGFDLYTQLLESAIKKLKGGSASVEVEDVEIKLPLSASIPHTYISKESLRLQLYKKIFSIGNKYELDSLQKEVEDRFGPIPIMLIRLFRVADLKRVLSRCRVKSINVAGSNGFATLSFSRLGEEQISVVNDMVSRWPKLYNLTSDYRLLLNINNELGQASVTQESLVETIIDLVQPISDRFEKKV